MENLVSGIMEDYEKEFGSISSQNESFHPSESEIRSKIRIISPDEAKTVVNELKRQREIDAKKIAELEKENEILRSQIAELEPINERADKLSIEIDQLIPKILESEEIRKQQGAQIEQMLATTSKLMAGKP